MRWNALCTAGAVAVTSQLVAAQLNVNLVQNPGAEIGIASPGGILPVPIPGWSILNNARVVAYGDPGQSGGFPTSASPGPNDRGNNFFSGGPVGNSTLIQVIDVSGEASEIDLNHRVFDFSAWLGGFGSEDDAALVIAVCADGQAQSLRTDTLTGPSSVGRNFQTGLFFRSTSAAVPPGTRQVLIQLIMNRVVGPYNHASADNISFLLRPAPCSDIDFNNDGLFPDNADLEDLLRVFGGGQCSTGNCDPIDFNGDGLFPDNQDLEDFFEVFGGGVC